VEAVLALALPDVAVMVQAVEDGLRQRKILKSRML
jgi:hypothetical protein